MVFKSNWQTTNYIAIGISYEQNNGDWIYLDLFFVTFVFGWNTKKLDKII